MYSFKGVFMGHILLLLLIMVLSSINLLGQTVGHNSQHHTLGIVSMQYLIADRVSLRKGPSSSTALVKTLDIATPLYALKESGTMETIKGIASSWYQVVAGKDTGWVWGGFIAQATAGSNEDPTVKFLVGFSGLDTVRGKDYAFETMHMQIRAVRGNTQLDRIIIPLKADWVEAYYWGRKGVKGVHDIIVVHQPCYSESCGCTVGDHFVFWDGAKLSKVYSALGMADAECSEGESIVFPSDMGGEEGYIKLVQQLSTDVDSLGNSLEDSECGDVQVEVVSYYTWNGSKLVAATNKPKAISKLYYAWDEKEGYIVVPPPKAKDAEEND